MKKENEIIKCVICTKDIVCDGFYWGHNPYPIFDEGRCCHDCNDTVNMERVRRVIQTTYNRNPSDDNKAILQSM